MKKLILVRHAKSSWSDRNLGDRERPLNARGERDGPAMQAWLGTQPNPAEWIWCSSAERTRQTCAFVSAGFSLDTTRVCYEDDLYHATAETAFDFVRTTPEDVGSVAILFHNPGITYLAHQLAPQAGIDNVPTFGVLRLSTPDPWVSAGLSGFQLDTFMSPKRLP